MELIGVRGSSRICLGCADMGVQIIEGFGDLNGIHYQFRVLLGPRQSSSAGRVNGTVYYDVGYVHSKLGIFLRQHLCQRAHHHSRIVQRLSGVPLESAQGRRVIGDEERAMAALSHGRQHLLGDQERSTAGDVLRGVEHLHRDVFKQFFLWR